MTTMKTAKTELKALGMKITKTDDEYRVTFRDMPAERAEAVAYYTNNLGDAVATAKAMARDEQALKAYREKLKVN